MLFEWIFNFSTVEEILRYVRKGSVLWNTDTMKDVGVWITAILLFVLTVCLVPIAVPVYLVVFSYRTIVAYDIKRRFSKVGPSDYPCGQLLTPIDVMVLKGNTHGLNIPCASFVLDGVPKLEDVKREFLEKVVSRRDADGKIRFPRFSMWIDSWFGLYFWNYAQEFDIDRHVRLFEEDVAGLRQLRTVIAELSNAPLFGPGKPVWELILVPFKDSEAEKQKCAVLLRFHHSMGNGVSTLRILMDSIWLDEDNEVASKKMSQLTTTKHQQTQSSKVPVSQKVMFILKACLFAPYFAFYTALTGDKKHALHGKEPANYSQVSWSELINIESLRPVRTATNCSVNDIYLACLAGALRRYFVAKKYDIPNVCSFICPVSLESLSEPPQHGNKHSFIIARLAMDVSEPLERLKSVKKIMDAKKSCPDYLINTWWPTLMMNTFPNWLMHKMFKSANITLVSSNVPGPNFRVKMFGYDVREIMAFLPTVEKIGLGIAMFSLNGEAQIALNMDKSLESNQDGLDDIVHYFQDEVRLLCQLCS